MHEMSLMASVFEIINEQLAIHKANRVLKVKLRVGEMTNAVPESLEFAFEAFARGSKAEGAQLEIAVVKAEGRCGECNHSFHPNNFILRCPECGSLQVHLTAGRDLLVESLEVE